MINAETIAALRPTATPDDGLRESLRQHGWRPAYPAVRDENKLILAGNRRYRLALELNIKPVFDDRTYGEGEDADNERILDAMLSNEGSEKLTTEDKKRYAIALKTKENWTQERIAKVLRVSQKTASLYLAGIYTGGINSPDDKPKPAPAKDGTRRGRPPGSSTKSKPEPDPKPGPTPAQAAPKAAAPELEMESESMKPKTERPLKPPVVVDDDNPWRTGIDIKAPPEDWNAFDELARKEGLSRTEKIAQLITACVHGDSVPVLSKTARENIDTEMRRHQRKLDMEFEQRVRAEIIKREEIFMPHELELIAKAERIEAAFRGVMTPAQYRNLQRCLHTDTLSGIRENAKRGTSDDVDRLYDEAFHLITKLKDVLVKEPSKVPVAQQIPRTPEEWLKRRDAATAARKAKRNTSKSTGAPA
jgi:transcriptional regulator with XRE-family HTH domain